MLNKQSININFSNGVNTKADPFQLPIGQFVSLENTIFNKDGLLQKRNGFGPLASLNNSNSTFLTTFNGNLTAIGTTLQAFSLGSNMWVSKGNLQPIELDTLSLITSNTNQTQVDTAVSANGLVCTVYTDQDLSNLAQKVYKYSISDSTTGQNIVSPTSIPSGSGSIVGSPRVFLLGNYFIIVISNLVSAVNRLQYLAIPIYNPSSISANPVDISGSYIPATTVSFDGLLVNNNLYLAWTGADGGGAIRMLYITPALASSTTSIFAGHTATNVSIAADTSSTPVIYVSIYDSVSQDGFTMAVDVMLNSVFAFTSIISAAAVPNITSTATNGSCNVYAEVTNAYGYDSSIPTNYIKKTNVTHTGVVAPGTIIVRSVGLASKAFLVNGIGYYITIYKSQYQPSYFLVNDSGQVVAKLAYSNATSTYYTVGLPSITLIDNVACGAYFFRDQIQAVNKSQGVANSAGIYSQLGLKLVKFTIGTSNLSTAEIGKDLNISGGLIWSYDGYTPVEQGFNLWPDSVKAVWSATGGSIAAKPDGSTNTNAYFYQVTYEWSDNQGNIFRSAPSIPVSVTTSGAGSAGSITLDVPTLRLTYKTANPVKIVIYRWSVAQQNYYQVTSVSTPLLNDTSIDYVTYVDTLADASILGNNLIYTTGGVLEDIGPPASKIMTLYESRLFLVDAEDQNLLWFSKKVIEATPVEMSDLLTLYIAPTIGSQGSTGPITSLSAMDDKLIIGKQNAFYYINGSGPDNTGANNGYSEPIFITATVGCANQQSFVLIPDGLMFQSDKGIWLLGRDLSTNYIGAPVEAYNDSLVVSAISVPGTNQVRFTLDSGITLMYDYYFKRWGVFTKIPAISSTLYEGLHTYLKSDGSVFQETPDKFLDNTSPILMKFQTGWINLAGIQGLQRFLEMYLLGTYITPFKLNTQLAFDYNSSNQQSTIITPDNYSPAWGGEQLWGSGSAWGSSNVFEARLFPQIQKCESFQLTIAEMYDSSYGVAAGAGLTLSGMNIIAGMERGYRLNKASRNFG